MPTRAAGGPRDHAALDLLATRHRTHGVVRPTLAPHRPVPCCARCGPLLPLARRRQQATAHVTVPHCVARAATPRRRWPAAPPVQCAAVVKHPLWSNSRWQQCKSWSRWFDGQRKGCSLFTFWAGNCQESGSGRTGLGPLATVSVSGCTDRQIDRQTDRKQADRRTDRRKDRMTERQKDGRRDRQAVRREGRPAGSGTAPRSVAGKGREHQRGRHPRQYQDPICRWAPAVRGSIHPKVRGGSPSLT